MKDISLVRILPQEPRVPFISARMIAGALSIFGDYSLYLPVQCSWIEFRYRLYGRYRFGNRIGHTRIR